ncbi:MAG: TonB-dependent receptor [Magnetospirillum sp.]|nr:TonB-dependent receptor [Magnetospirillum sp.]
MAVFILPTQTAANLFNRGLGVRLLNVMTNGLLQVVASDEALTSISALKGRRVAVPYRNDTPEVIFRRLLVAQGMDPERDLTLQFVGSPMEAVQMLATGRVEAALLPEPTATAALMSSGKITKPLYRTIDVQRAWGEATGLGPVLPQAGMGVTEGFLAAHGPAVEALQAGLAAAAAAVNADREYYINRNGSKGALFGRNELDSSTLAVNAGFNLPVAEKVVLSPALTIAYATRDNDDVYGAATRPTYNVMTGNGSQTARDTSYSRDYTGISPSLGLSYRPAENHMLFGAVSRSFEPPTHDDLLATNGGTPNSSPTGFVTPDLDAQTGTTVEAGWRGGAGIVSVDAVTYYSWLKNEILSLRDATGVSLGAMNADRTRHLGLELGGNVQATDKLGLRMAYTYQDFRFQDDPVRGDNRLAGAPRHLVNAVVRYDLTPAWMVQTDVTWSPTRTPVDNMNTLYADPYTTVALRSSYALTEQVSVYGEARNIFDETYAASTLVVDQAQANQAAFLPADGRAFYAGVKAKF